MKQININSILLVPALLLALTGCGASSDTSDDLAGNSDNSCTTETTNTTQYTTLPQITYTEVDEGSAANDSRETAQDIETNSIVTGEGSYQFPGAGCIDCDDYYVMAVTEGDEFEFELTTVSGMTAFLLLFNGPDYITQVEGGDSVKRLSYTIPSGMTELVVYINTYQGTGEYTLKTTSPQEPVAIEEVPSAQCLANLNGSVSNAVSGAVLSAATINLREGEGVKAGVVDHTVTSTSDGSYSFTDVDAGTYTAEVAISGFITNYVTIDLAGDKTTEKKFQLSPTLADGEVRIVMSWGASPNILDSYLNGPKSDTGAFTVYYKHRSDSNAQLDRDATSGYGPETITISTQHTGTYTYWINNYSNRSNSSSTALAASGATVTVYGDAGIVKQYSVPSGAGTKWNVFTMTSGVVTDVNTLSDWSEQP